MKNVLLSLLLTRRWRRRRPIFPSNRWSSTSMAWDSSNAPGTLGPGESARLDFNASDMNDVLKSLTLTDSGGGKISGLRYDSMDPLSHKLAEFPFQIEGGQSLAAMFDQLKGARVELKLGNDTVAGIIVTGRVVGRHRQAERARISHPDARFGRDAHGGSRARPAASASPTRKLQAQFKDYLAALAAARSKDKRSVYIDSSDAKERARWWPAT